MDTKSYEIVLADLQQEIKVKRNKSEKLLNEISQIENVMTVLQIKLKEGENLHEPSNNEFEVQNKNGEIEEEPSKQNESVDDEEFTLLTENEYTRENQSKISLNNASEKILKKEGKALYITDLIERLKEYGRFTDRKQLSGTIRKDNKDRFINLGGNNWDLKSRHQ